MTTQDAAFDLARKAYKLIEDESRWTRHHHARDRNGNPVDYDDPMACSFCSIGAIRRVAALDDTYSSEHRSNTEFALEKCVFASTDSTTTPDFNDRYTHAEVLALWRKAFPGIEQ